MSITENRLLSSSIKGNLKQFKTSSGIGTVSFEGDLQVDGNITYKGKPIFDNLLNSSYSVNVGNSEYTNQEQYTVGVGYRAGQNSQAIYSVAIGKEAGYSGQLGQAVAVGVSAGSSNQGNAGVAVGSNSGTVSQGWRAVSVGHYSGDQYQGQEAVCIGYRCGEKYQGQNAVSIGRSAGYSNQGGNCIAIGSRAGEYDQSDNSIVINATGLQINGDASNACFIAPIREASFNSCLYYNTLTNEVVKGAIPSVNSGATGWTGATGMQGSNGLKGDTGETGATGMQGSNGLKGDTGWTGPAGASVESLNQLTINGDLSANGNVYATGFSAFNYTTKTISETFIAQNTDISIPRTYGEGYANSGEGTLLTMVVRPNYYRTVYLNVPISFKAKILIDNLPMKCNIDTIELKVYQDAVLFNTYSSTVNKMVIFSLSSAGTIAYQYIKNIIQQINIINTKTTNSIFTFNIKMTATAPNEAGVQAPNQHWILANVSSGDNVVVSGSTTFSSTKEKGWSAGLYSVVPLKPTGMPIPADGIVSINQLNISNNWFHFVPWTDSGYTITTSGGTSFNGLITGSTTNPSPAGGSLFKYMYSIIGNTMYLNFFYSNTSNSGSSGGDGYYTYKIPAGYYIDTSFIQTVTPTTSTSTAYGTVLGTANMVQFTPNASLNAEVVCNSNTTLCIFVPCLCSNNGFLNYFQYQSNGVFSYGNANQRIAFTCSFPII